MGKVDQEALRLFQEGSTPEARRAMGHLLRNALCPLSIQISTVQLQPELLTEIGPEMERTARRVADLITAMVG